MNMLIAQRLLTKSKDEIAGICSSFCAFGVAFFPKAPRLDPTLRQQHIGAVNSMLAALLFLTLADFCFALFKMSADKNPDPRKEFLYDTY